ncbi:hypothetical protein GN958_ATG03708, partial [Phytophthora infestans]
VHYSFNAHVILISLGCMRTCGFKLVFEEDQSTTWLCKDGLMLRFDCYDILYRMRVKRSLRLVGAAVNRQKSESASLLMTLLLKLNNEFKRADHSVVVLH